MMKRWKLALTTAVLTTAMSTPSMAGTWTHTKRYEDGEEFEYSTLWLYIKDDGTYAKSEWIQDTDGTWYWVESDESLPIHAGISDDGYLFDENGRYDPMEGKYFLTLEGAAAIKENMTYEQVLSLLGTEHERILDSIVFDLSGVNSYATCVWYSNINNGKLTLEFTNGVVSDIYGYFY